MKKLFCSLLIFTMAISAFAEITVTGTAPTVKGGVGADLFNSDTQKAFNEALKELNDHLKVFKSPDDFLESMGNSSVYASHGATTRGYGGYKLFSATVGPMFGLQLPTGISSIADDLDGLSDSLEKKGDIKLGISPNVFNANIGLNMGIMKFLPEHLGIIKRDNLYVGLRFGYFNLSELDIGDDLKLNYNNFTLGLTVNYQLVPSISLGLVAWRGVSLGSGFLYNRSKLGFDMTVDDIKEPIDNGASVVINKPKASINLTTNTFTIPLEAITAVKLLIFNIPFGIGADISFGKTSLGAGVNADIDIEGLQGYSLDKKGTVTVNGDLSNSPSIFNFKLMTGFGLSMGPVVLDIPITYYPTAGYNIGITIGAVY